MTETHTAAKDALDLARIRRWAAAFKPGQSMTVNRDLMLHLITLAEGGSR